jgi:hypothetical protein
MHECTGSFPHDVIQHSMHRTLGYHLLPADMESHRSQDPASISIIVKLVFHDKITDNQSGSGGSSVAQELSHQIGLLDSQVRFVSQQLFSGGLESVIVHGVQGEVQTVNSVHVILLDGSLDNDKKLLFS